MLNGTKMWITNGHEADTLVVYAKTDMSAGARGITAFLIEKGFKGFSPRTKTRQAWHARLTHLRTGVYEDCEVPEENLLGRLNDGVTVLMSGLDYERAVLAAGPVGIMQAAIDLVLPYARERKQFGKPIGEFQLVQGKLADIYSAMNASRAYVYAVARACDNGRITRQDAAGAILFRRRAGDARLHWMQSSFSAVPAMSMKARRVGLLRDAKLYEIGAGTSEIRRMLIGRELVKGNG